MMKVMHYLICLILNGKAIMKRDEVSVYPTYKFNLNFCQHVSFKK